MKRTLTLLILPLALLSLLVYAARDFKSETKTTRKPSAAIDKKAQEEARKKWEASPDGIQYKAWERSAAGKKVQASYYKIKKQIDAFSNMEAVVTSVTFQRTNVNSGPKWLIVKIEDEEYMLQFPPKDFEKLSGLKVNDKIIVKSRSAGYSPNHPYLILSSDYIAHNNQLLFIRDLSKNKGC